MIAGISLEAVVLVGLIVLVGSFVQGTIGLGLGMVGAPLIAIVEPVLVPTLILVLTVPMSSAVAYMDRHHIDWRVIAWMLPARIPGTFLGVWLVTSFSHRVLGVVVAVLVLLAVVLTVRTVTVRPSPLTLAGAGLAAGTSGTAAAIGGPPVALVLADRQPRVARGTMSFFFVAGSLLSVLWFAAVGELPLASLVLGALYFPLIPLSVWLGHHAHVRLPRETFRNAVLVLCTLSAVVLLIRSLVG